MRRHRRLLPILTAASAVLAVGALAAPAPQSPPKADGIFVAQAQRPARVLFDNGNIDAVFTRPQAVAVFDLARRSRISVVTTYHWNDARGARPGWIALIGEDGALFGPWLAEGSPGQGGVPDAYWTVHPGVTLPPGRYMVIDSDPVSWAQNAGSGGAGIVHVEGSTR